MLQVRKFLQCGLLLCLAAFGGALSLRGAETVWKCGFSPEESALWSRCDGASFENGVLKIVATDRKSKNMISTRFDFSPHAGKVVTISADIRYSRVSKPEKPWNGVKLMMKYSDADGQMFHQHPAGAWGDGDWKRVVYGAIIAPGAQRGEIVLGLEDSTGTVEYRNLQLDVRDIGSSYPSFVPENYTASYSDRMASAGRFRGVMSPSSFTPEILSCDLPDLKSWGANLIRWQLIRNWNTVDSDQDVDEYLRWIEARIPELKQLLDRAEELGLKVVLDLHVPPGGRREGGEMNMFHERKFADAFLAAWERLAGAVKGHPALYGYDIINEPCQNPGAMIDYLSLQYEAAKRIRAIDPETPLIVESNNWAQPESFSYLTPLPLEDVIYQFHMYAPHGYTHQGVGSNPVLENGYPGEFNGEYFNKEKLREILAPVRKFQQKYNAKIYVGEFSVIRWGKGGERYLADCIALFEEYGWDWSYHAFREWSGWSVEHGEDRRDESVSPVDTARKKVLLDGFRRNAAAPASKRVPVSDADAPGESMERGVEARPVLWSENFDTVEGALRFTADREQWDSRGGRNHSGCLRFRCREANAYPKRLKLDPAPFRGRTIVLEGYLQARNLQEPEKPYWGPKLTLYSKDGSGHEEWLDQEKRYGSYDWSLFRTVMKVPPDAVALEVQLGIQQGIGELAFDDLRLYELEELKPATPQPSEAEQAAVRPPFPAEVEIVGPWRIRCCAENLEAEFDVPPPEPVTVRAERYAKLRTYVPGNAPWDRGERMRGVFNGCTTPDALVPESVVVRREDGSLLERGRDYQFDSRWGTIGRLEGGRIGPSEAVLIDYVYFRQRLDSIFMNGGKLEYRCGEPKIAQALPPDARAGESRVANLFLPGKQNQLENGNLYPVLETGYPVRPAPVADELLPNTMRKLRNGEVLRILAWGDSITDGGYLRDESGASRWQQQFVERLRERFPQSKIELMTEAWGGRNTNDYFAVPPGRPHNYQEKVLALKPDLVISEFINDTWHTPVNFDTNYNRIRDDFRAVGAEWILITPGYQRAAGLESAAEQKECDDDPRYYVAMLRDFARRNHLPVADVSARYGRLWRQGIPFLTLLTNQINHPNRQGMAIYADALLALFPEK